MIKTGSTQFSYKYGNQLHMPYTIAVLISYLKSNTVINDNCTFLPVAVDRIDFDKYVNIYKDIDILLCSCYIWNWEITKKFSEAIKKINPKCLIIFGGPQIPEDSNTFFKDYDFVDVFVHNEGELSLTNIFLSYISKKSFDGIPGISTKTKPQWVPENIIKNIDDIPSPYISNLMWDLIDKHENVVWLGIMETIRGCPYACSYCAWGASSYNAVRKFSLDRVFHEIDFFSDNKLTYIDCSDANFGMFERDIQITDYIVNKKKITGFPTSFKPCWDKNINDRIKYIAKSLKSVDLLVSVGCSLQTLSQEALKVNNRKSVTFPEFLHITDHFKKDNSQCYTEMIRGLPGETLDSFTDGLNRVIFQSNVDTVFIYNCSSYEATELNSGEFKEKYKVEIVKSPVFLSHASINKQDIIEYDYIITSSYSFTKEDLTQMYVYSWYMMVFQFFGITNYITEYLRNIHGIDYKSFYNHFVKYCENNPDSLFGKEYDIVVRHGVGGFNGNGWDHVDNNLGPINWPIEEASFLRLVQNKKLLNEELNNFLKSIINVNNNILDLIKFQTYTLSNKENTTKYVSGNFNIDWKTYFKNKIIKEAPVRYLHKNKIPTYTDNFDWNTQCIWYGRRKINYKATIDELQYDIQSRTH